EPPGADANVWFIGTALIRETGQKYSSKEPLSFPEAHRLNADHRFRQTEKKINFEYDFKRRLVDPVPKFLVVPAVADEGQRLVQHLCCNTVPWQTVAEFNETRDQFEQWRQKYGGKLQTVADLRRWEEFQAGATAS